MALSIVIPNLNAPTIQATLESIYQQEELPGAPEILVVGQDRAGCIKPHPWLRFIKTPQALLPGAARNLGAAQSSGQIIVFVDADIILLPDALCRLSATVQEYDIVGGSIMLEAGPYWQLARNIMSFSFCTSDMPPAERDHLPSMLLACRREVWQRVGEFRSDFWVGEDVEWGVRARNLGCSIRFEPAIRCYHRPLRLSLYQHWQRWQHYGYGWGLVYQQLLRGNEQFPLYTPRARTEYVWRLSHSATRGSLIWLRMILLSWILSVTLRDTLIVYLRRTGVHAYWYTAPALWILMLAWYAGLLRYALGQEV
jgi:glycosyltransferase involved in cell wall biosynthesis